jgi:hypothetical protein
MKKNITLLVLIILSNLTFAQTENYAAIAESNLATLKEGFLLVKIPTFYKKLAVINEDLRKYEKDAKYVAHLNTRKREIEQMANDIKIDFLRGLSRYYKMSAVVVVFDSLETKFYDTDLREKKDFLLTGKNYLICRKSTIIKAENQLTSDVFIITDKEGKEVFRPFIGNIPLFFKRLRVLKYDKKSFPRVSEDEKDVYKSRKSWHKMDSNPYFAMAKMLELKLSSLEKLLQLGK